MRELSERSEICPDQLRPEDDPTDENHRENDRNEATAPEGDDAACGPFLRSRFAGPILKVVPHQSGELELIAQACIGPAEGGFLRRRCVRELEKVDSQFDRPISAGFNAQLRAIFHNPPVRHVFIERDERHLGEGGFEVDGIVHALSSGLLERLLA